MPDGASCVHLLSSFACSVDRSQIVLAGFPRALVVSLALRGHQISRSVITDRLWPDTEPERAAKRLRQTLWRIRRVTQDHIVTTDPDAIGLADGVRVDLIEAEGLARLALASDVTGEELAAGSVARWRSLSEPLFSDDSAGDELWEARQSWDRLRLLALEKITEARLAQGKIVDAIELACMAMTIDGLREGPHRLLAQAHLAHSEVAAAQRVYAGYSLLLRDSLGIDPSPEFERVFERALWTRRPAAPHAVPTVTRRAIG
jgi:DNA-binding SARP family transcriptional activator